MISENLSAQLNLLPDYLSHHLLLSLTALAAGIIICLPLALLITRVKPLQTPVLALASMMQTIPGIALLALMVPLLGMIGFFPAVIALFIYSILPILRNTVTGITGIDKSITEAAQGIGMTSAQSLWKVELPLALPVIIAGIRTSAVWVIGTATLSTPVGATSLGNYIFSGLQTQNHTAVLVGSLAAATLAIVLDALIRLVETAAKLRSRRRAMIAIALLVAVISLGLSPLIRSSSDSAKPLVVVGAKTFTEQYILSELLSSRLREAGFNAESRSSLGSTVLFEALVNGSVDCYVDYSGTIWANQMKRSDLLPPDSLIIEMSLWLKDEHDILCLGPLGFENTYALALPEQLADSLNVRSINDLAPFSPQLSIASDYEFFGRPEWKSLSLQYGLAFKDKKSLDHSLMYPAVANRQVDVISAYSTDGWIVDYNLRVLTDPLHALPPYDAVLLLSPKAARNRRLVAALKGLVRHIDSGLMRQANKIVDVDGRTVAEAASFISDRLP